MKQRIDLGIKFGFSRVSSDYASTPAFLISASDRPRLNFAKSI